MKLFNKCPICGKELITKEVEKLLRGGTNTAIVKVEAEVCLHCGERLYSEDNIQWFEEIRNKLNSQKITEYQPVGKTYQVVQLN